MTNTDTSNTQAKNDGIKKQLKALLSNEGINKIYFVDETNVVDISIIIGLIVKGISIGKDQELKKITIDFFSTDADIFSISDFVEQNWASLDMKGQIELASKIAFIVDPKRSIDLQIVSQLQIYFDNLVPLTPSQWTNQKNELEKSLTRANQKVVVLFDEELGEDFPRGGHAFIEEIVKNQWSSFVPIIFSNGITTYSDEIPWRNNLSKRGQSTLEKRDFFALSKKRKDDLNTFADGIKKALLNSYCEKIKDESIKVFKAAFDEALEDLDNWDTYDFDHVILQSSYKEGIWEPFTLERIMRIKFEDLLAKQMINSSYAKAISPVIKKTRKYSSYQFELPEEEPFLHRYKLRYSELYANGTEVNKLNLPVENGDIFEIYGEKSAGQYILVGQECDLMVRTNNKGKRASDVGILLEVTPRTNVELEDDLEKHYSNSKMVNFWENRYLLPYYDSTQGLNGIVKFASRSRLIVDLDIIDLVVYNSEGKADLDLGAASPDLSSFSAAWELRHKKIQQRFKDAAKSIDQIHSDIAGFNVENQNLILNNSITIKLSFIRASGIEPSYKNNRFSYGIKRVGRLRQAIAQHLLEKYTSYLSRRAFGHDYAKDID